MKFNGRRGRSAQQFTNRSRVQERPVHRALLRATRVEPATRSNATPRRRRLTPFAVFGVGVAAEAVQSVNL